MSDDIEEHDLLENPAGDIDIEEHDLLENPAGDIDIEEHDLLENQSVDIDTEGHDLLENPADDFDIEEHDLLENPADDIDIEEHDLLENPALKEKFPDLSLLKLELKHFEEGLDFKNELLSATNNQQNASNTGPKFETEIIVENLNACDEISDDDDMEEDGQLSHTRFGSNVIILGSKPAQPLEYEEFVENQVICSQVKVVLDDLQSYLNVCGRYCQDCQTLYPSKEEYSTHNNTLHSAPGNKIKSTEQGNVHVSTASNSKTACGIEQVQSFTSNEILERVHNNLKVLQQQSDSNVIRVCFHCNEIFATPKSLIEHLYMILQSKKNSEKAPEKHISFYKCELCSYYMKRYLQYDGHMKSKHESLPKTKEKVQFDPKCRWCPIEFANVQDYNLHLRKEHAQLLTQKENKCPRKVINSEQQIIDNRPEKQPKDGNEYYQCQVCFFYFSVYKIYKAHMINKHQSSDYPRTRIMFNPKCKLCPRTNTKNFKAYNCHLVRCHKSLLYAKKDLMERTASTDADHIEEPKQLQKLFTESNNRSENRETYYRCHICSYYVKNYKLYKAHTLNKHQTLPRGTLVQFDSKCKWCPSELKNINSYNSHLIKRHWNKMAIILSQNNKFEKVNQRERTALKQNPKSSETLTDETFYRCHICSQYFANDSVYTSHMSTKHCSEPKAEEKVKFNTNCRWCSLSGLNDIMTYNDHVLRKHKAMVNIKETVSNPTSVVPNINKLFILKTALFKCTKCDIHFLSAKVAIDHVNHMEMLINWKCSTCNRIFKKEDALLHEIQHGHSQKFTVYDLCLVPVHRVLFKCPLCTIHFTEDSYKQHHAVCEDATTDSDYCKICDIIIDSAIQKVHENSHIYERLKPFDFTIVDDADVVATVEDQESDDTRKVPLPSAKSTVQEEEICKKNKTERDDFVRISASALPRPFLHKCEKCEIHFISNIAVLSHHCNGIDFLTCPECDIKLSEGAFKVHMIHHNGQIIETLSKPESTPKSVKKTKANTKVAPDSRSHNKMNIQSSELEDSIVRESETLNVVESDDKLKCLVSRVILSRVDDENECRQMLNLFYCKKCKLFSKNVTKNKHRHIFGRCSSVNKYRRVCNKCGLVFGNRAYNAHKVLHYVKKGLKLTDFKIHDVTTGKRINCPMPEYPRCKDCGVSFASFDTKRHICNKEETVECSICENTFTPKALILHLAFHATAVSKNVLQFETGTSTLTEYGPIDCENGVELMNYKPLTVIYCCKNCHLSVDTYDKVIEHCQDHYSSKEIEINTVTCTVCNLNFDETCVENHKRIHSSNIDDKKYTLLHFDSLYLTSEHNVWIKHVFGNMPQKHILKMISESIYMHECRIKMEIVQEGPPALTVYHCDKCRSFVDENNLYKHAENSCFKLRKHPCSFCGLAFISSVVRMKHEKIHMMPHNKGKDINLQSYRIVTFNKQDHENFNKLLQNRSRCYVLYQCRSCGGVCDKTRVKSHECYRDSLSKCSDCGLLFSAEDYQIHSLRHKDLKMFTGKNFKVILFGPGEYNTNAVEDISAFKGLIFDYTLYYCNICQTCVKSNMSTLTHSCLVGNCRIQCPHCKLFFVTGQAKQHIKLHEGDPDFTRENMRLISFEPSVRSIQNENPYNTMNQSTAANLIHSAIVELHDPNMENSNNTSSQSTTAKSIDSEDNPDDTLDQLVVSNMIRATSEVCDLAEGDRNAPINLGHSASEEIVERKKIEEASSNKLIKNRQETKTVKIYRCNCGLHFLDQLSIVSHLQLCTPKIRVSRQVCSKCGLTFTPNILFHHLLKHHGNKNQLYVLAVVNMEKNNIFYRCCKCECSFGKNINITNHVKSCIGKTTGKICSHCKLKIADNYFLSHECGSPAGSSLSGVEVIEFNKPDITVTSTTNNCAEDEESDVTPYTKEVYKCQECGVHYLTKRSVRSHLTNKHSSVVQLQDICNICGLNFASSALSKHVQIHHEILKIKANELIVVEYCDDML